MPEIVEVLEPLMSGQQLHLVSEKLYLANPYLTDLTLTSPACDLSA